MSGMSDLDAAVASIRAELVLVTGRIENIDRRRSELDREHADLSRRRDELEVTLGVIESHVVGGTPSGPTDEVPGEPRFTERVLAAIVDLGSASRADLKRKFTPGGVNENTLDSAIRRLVKRGSVRRDGRRLVPVPSPAPAVDPPVGGVPPAAAGASAGGSTAADAVSGSDPVSGPVDAAADDAVDADADRPLAHQVRDAIGTGIETREALLRHFLVRGVERKALKDAIWGLRRRGAVEELSEGRYAVVVKRGSLDLGGG